MGWWDGAISCLDQLKAVNLGGRELPVSRDLIAEIVSHVFLTLAYLDHALEVE